MEFESAPKELQELCLCGGGPMGKVPLKMPLKKEPEKKPDEHGQGSLF